MTNLNYVKVKKGNSKTNLFDNVRMKQQYREYTYLTF